MNIATKISSDWSPPVRLSKEEMVRISEAVIAEPDIPFNEYGYLFRIHSNGFDWDIGNVVYAPTDPTQNPIGRDGKKIGIFMTHGGASDGAPLSAGRGFCGKRGSRCAR